jgi:integrase
MFSSIKKFFGLGITIESLLDQFMESRRVLNLRPMTMTNYEIHRKWMLGYFGGGRPAASITPDDMREVLAEKSRETVELTHTLYRWAKAEKLVWSLPTEGILPRPPRSDEKPVCYMKWQDAHRFFDAARPGYRAAFALALFAGVRPYEVCRINWLAIHAASGSIKIDAWVSKIRRARIIEGVPEILWDLLAPIAHEAGPVFPLIVKRNGETDYNFPGWIVERRNTGKRAGVELGHDILRHTFATYFVALTGNTSLAAKVLGHYGLRMLGAHYDGVETCANAEKFFKTTRKDFFAKLHGRTTFNQ